MKVASQSERWGVGKRKRRGGLALSGNTPKLSNQLRESMAFASKTTHDRVCFRAAAVDGRRNTPALPARGRALDTLRLAIRHPASGSGSGTKVCMLFFSNDKRPKSQIKTATGT